MAEEYFPTFEDETPEEYHARFMRSAANPSGDPGWYVRNPKPRTASEVFRDPRPRAIFRKVNFDTQPEPDCPESVDAQGERYEERAGVLDDARKAIVGDRNARYGRPSANFQMIADLWKGMGMQVQGGDVKPHHVAMALALLKISRLTWSPDHKDNWVDLAGYAGCGYEAYLEDDSNK